MIRFAVAEVGLEQRFTQSRVRQVHVNSVCEPSPHGWVEQLLVISCSKQHTLRRQAIDVLQQSHYDSFQFAEFLRIVTRLSQRVEFIEK